MNTEQPEDDRWSSYFDGDERVTIYKTEGEAVGEMECVIDGDGAYDASDEVEYRVAPMLSAKHILRKYDGRRIGDALLENINEQVNDDMFAEDDPLDMTPEDKQALGELVIQFICSHAKSQWWTVDTKREQKRTYVVGSKDADEAQPNTTAETRQTAQKDTP